MTPTRSESNYSIQSNGFGPGHSSHKSKRQECQPRGDAQMEDAITSTSSQRLARIFDTLIESPEAEINAISAVRSESLSTGKNRYVPFSVQELVYGSKKARVARKDRGTSEGWDTHVLERTSPTDKILVEKPEHVIRGPGNEIGIRKAKQPSGRSPILNKCQRSPRKPQRPTRRAIKKAKGKAKPK
ncbi:hypothetical protein O181_133464, partial [Austropuccinia psidii MF-1]|nr:hypothetical protein [Austropuccinia psidii MF-1]